MYIDMIMYFVDGKLPHNSIVSGSLRYEAFPLHHV